MKSLAIVGAGASGLAAAWKLREEPVDVTIFEKSRGLCGRAASKTHEGVRFDQGANYFKTETAEVEDLILHQLPANELVDIGKDIWVFDKGGTISPGDPEQNASPKWTYRSGISTLGKLLAAEAKAEVHKQVRISHLSHTGEQWNLVDIEGKKYGPFDAVLLTPPAPQTQDLLEDSHWEGDLSPLIKALKSARYFTQFAFILGYDEELPRPGDFYALINTDRAHMLAWLSFENDKPGRVPSGQTAVVAQTHPGWSELNFERDEIELVPEVSQSVNTLLGWKAESAWWYRQRWKFAHPHQAADTKALQLAEPNGLFFAGDYLAGKGRVHLALQSGLDIAERIRKVLAG